MFLKDNRIIEVNNGDGFEPPYAHIYSTVECVIQSFIMQMSFAWFVCDQ